MTLDELRAEVEGGTVDTVLLVMTDMQGRLMGKRLHAPFFMAEIAEHGAEGCYYLLTVDVEMNTVQGYGMGSWDTGYGDFVFKPDFATLRRVPWLERTALVVADLEWHDGKPVVASPRQILRRQIDRLAERGWKAFVGSELEFILFRDSYEEARGKRYQDLHPANPYNVDYSIFGTTVVEDVLRPIRLGMAGAGIPVEDSKGECNFGQHEVNFRYSDALAMADNHSIYKNGAREIAWQHDSSITFMAKWNEREGNSCHIHCSFWDDKGSLFPDDGHGYSDLFKQFVAGQLRYTRELTYWFAPNVNSYKRFARGLVRPDHAGLGHGQPNLRVPCRRARQRPPAREPDAGRRREPVPGLRGDDRRRPARDRRGPGAGAGVQGQRVRGARPAADPLHAARRRRSAGRLTDGARGVHGRGGRPLRPRRPHRARGLRSGCHRLGALPRLRAVVRRTPG